MAYNDIPCHPISNMGLAQRFLIFFKWYSLHLINRDQNALPYLSSGPSPSWCTPPGEAIIASTLISLKQLISIFLEKKMKKND
jgi:hypothetical protein